MTPHMEGWPEAVHAYTALAMLAHPLGQVMHRGSRASRCKTMSSALPASQPITARHPPGPVQNLHWVFKVANRAATVSFCRSVLGLKVGTDKQSLACFTASPLALWYPQLASNLQIAK